MKVGVFLDEYIPEDGGAYNLQGEVLQTLFALAAESEHQFVIISPRDKKLADQVQKSNLEWLTYYSPGLIEEAIAFFVRTWPNLRARLRWRSSFERRARETGIEFLWFLGQRPRDVDLSYITVVFDLQHRLQPWFPEVNQFGQWELRERGFARTLRRASAVIVGTQVGKEEVVRFYQVPEERIHILPHPTPAYALNPESKSDALIRFGLQPGYLFYPAQFWAHKNHASLLLAVKQLREQGTRLQLVLAGSDFGNLNYVRQQIEALGLQDQVSILGFVTQSDLIALYQNALALTYLSFFGPENLPPLEAFALGCPVIAARVSGSEEQLGDAALLVDPANSTEIAAAIRKLHQNAKLRQRLVARGRDRAASWTVEEFVHGAFKILDAFEPIRRTWKI